MTTLSLVHSGPSITSLEIAGLVDSRHDKVRQSIERLAKRNAIRLPPMGIVEDKQSLSPNSKTKAYVFSGISGKRDSFVVVAQLSPLFTGRLVDRWMELESRLSQKPVLSLEDQSKVESYDRMLSSDGSIPLESAGQIFALGRTRFYRKLRELRVLTRRNRPYQVHVDADRFKVRIAEQDKYYSAETFVTPKGMVWLDGLLNPST